MVQWGLCGLCYGRNLKEYLFFRYANKKCFSGKKIITNIMSSEDKHLFKPELKFSNPILNLSVLSQNEHAYIKVLIINQM